jgi:16S rRNA (guanine1516-N2)-methyltransferase
MVHRVLADGVDRARRALPGLGRVQVRCADVYHVLQEGALYDVVYLDPMFPRRQKAALPQKRAQLLAMAAAAAPVAPATADLIDTAVRVARLRVVLKRRARDPVIGLPDWTVRASRVRFDVYRGGAQAGV